jgi:hypothetical protein
MRKELKDIEVYQIEILALNEVLKGCTNDNDVGDTEECVSSTVQGTADCLSSGMHYEDSGKVVDV